MSVFINKKEYDTFTPEQKEDFITTVFLYYRSHGFPFYSTSISYRDSEFIKLRDFSVKNIISNKIIGQSMHGLGLAWSYFPHSFSVRCNNLHTPMENFLDNDVFMKVIRKRMVMGTYMSDSGIRKMLRMYTGSQGVSNFRPTAASAIYDTYMKKGETTWDMCAGYGGRLLGAIKSEVNYVGNDPDVLTFTGLFNLASDYARNIKVQLVNEGCEVRCPSRNTIDFAFTSPPYFNTEKYSDSDTQSYIKYPEYDLWINGFMRLMSQNAYNSLRGSYCAINICNTKTAKTLEDDTIRVFCENGFKLEDELRLALSKFSTKNDSSKYKYEPVFIFKKIG